MRVLIVDDNEVTLGILRLVLAKLPDSECVACRSPLEALDMARAGKFDAIILDYIMPGLDGMTFARLIRATPGISDTPIVMITGCKTDELTKAAEDNAISTVMAKPLDLFALRRTLMELTDSLRNPARALFPQAALA